MPTLNAEAILENCLASIARQTYPREKIEIILAVVIENNCGEFSPNFPRAVSGMCVG